MIGDKDIIEFGDYQTPITFVENVCAYLKNYLGLDPEILFEPTFGLGNFIKGAINVFSNIKTVYGVEINESYCQSTEKELRLVNSCVEIKLFNENIFVFDFGNIKNEISKNDKILVLGNPPWITNSELTSIGSENIPLKDNFKGLKGLDAITGKGNFDIAEYIILQLLSEFANYNCYIAMLCKNIVAKNIVRDLPKYDFHLSDIRFLTFDAMSVFNVSCEAGLLLMKYGGKDDSKLVCDVYEFNDPSKKVRSFGWVDNNFISNIQAYNAGSSIDGKCPFVWRQGIKHDCSKVMELSFDERTKCLRNGFKEPVEIEDLYVYPMLKSSDLKGQIITQSRKRVIVPQKKIKEVTDNIQELSPKLWSYLNYYGHLLDGRKSSIYKNSPRFSIFGVGEYSYAKYKIAISGFYKEPNFVLVYSYKPMMLDDTCYLLPFNDYNSAFITMLLLNSDLVQGFIKSIAFLDSKRPYTKDVLMRIDINKVSEIISYEMLKKIAMDKKIPFALSNIDYQKFKRIITPLQGTIEFEST